MGRQSYGGLSLRGAEPLISAATSWENMLFLSGRAPVDLATMRVISDDFEEQARNVLDQCLEGLREAGSGPEHVLRVQCYLLNAEDFDAWNRLWLEYFPAPRPARTTICTGFAVPGMLIEVELTAGIRGALLELVRRDATPGSRLVRDVRPSARDAGGRRMTPKKVVVVGAGISGLCCAYYLRQRDVDVTILDGEPVGSRVASSFGNGGWICPAQAGPLPEPGLTLYGLRALMKVDSALYFKPSYLPRLAPWLARFWTYCNPRDFERGTAALAELGKPVFDLVDGMVADGIEFELYKMGMICATADARNAQKVLDSLRPMRQYGYRLPDDLLDEDALHELEPSLSAKVKAGFFYDEQWHVRADTMTVGIAARLRAMGVEILDGARVESFDAGDGGVRSVRTPKGDFQADAFVLAAGSWTQPLAAKLGSRFPMEPGKGYSFLVKPKVMPKHGILFSDIHAGATPLGDRIRLSGTMEFSGYDLAVDRRRIATIHRLAKDYVELERQDYEEAWGGLRPLTPDGLPVIDWARPYRNAYVATGYSMLGMTVSAPAGDALTEMILTGNRPPVLEPFRSDRFRGVRLPKRHAA